MNSAAAFLKLGATPYVVLGLVWINDGIEGWSANHLWTSPAQLYGGLFFVLMVYGFVGLLLASLHGSCKGIYGRKVTFIIILCNLFVMAAFFIVGYFGVYIFINIKNFFVFDFILLGSYTYVLIQTLRTMRSNRPSH